MDITHATLNLVHVLAVLFAVSALLALGGVLLGKHRLRQDDSAMLAMKTERDALRRQVNDRMAGADGKHGVVHRAVHNAAEAILFRAVTAEDVLRVAQAHVEQLAAFAAHVAAGGDPDEGRRDKWKRAK